MQDYLTEEEYERMGFAEICEPFIFDNLLMRASAILDNKTRHHYTFVKFDDDVEWRVKKFKQAVGMQIEYFVQNEATTTSQMNDKPMSMSVGRTTISRGGKSQSVGNNNVSLECPDIIGVLEGTGLLYRGVN